MEPSAQIGAVSRLLSFARRALRAIGHEIAATIRFGAIPAAAAPRGRPARSDAAAVVAGMGVIRDASDEAQEGRPSLPP